MRYHRAMVVRALTLAFVLALPHAVSAQAEAPLVLPADALFHLATQPYLDLAAFRTALGGVLPSARIRPGDAPDPPFDDPFLWALGGTFGAQPDIDRPGAIFGCARYGLATRDWFADQGFSAPASFRLMGQVLPLSDDATLWPEGAVARLHCTFVWDDARRVAIVPRAEAEAALALRFSQVIVEADGALQPLPLYGEAGFRLHAIGGAVDSVGQVESGTIILTQGHQAVSFRAFLMGGGF